MDLERELGSKLLNGIKINEPMSLHTSWKVGGPADYFLGSQVNWLTLSLCLGSRSALICFGNGTNLLVRDGGIRG